MNATRCVATVLLLVCSDAARAAPPAPRPEPPPGAAACTGCHTDNARMKTAVPRIHGRRADDIVAAMAAFRSGSRAATIMDRVAKGFTDDETRAIAAWFASQKQDSP